MVVRGVYGVYGREGDLVACGCVGVCIVKAKDVEDEDDLKHEQRHRQQEQGQGQDEGQARNVTTPT